MNTHPTTHHPARSSDLRLGDLVLCHGMRVRLDTPPTSSATPGSGLTCWSYRGTVENADEVITTGLIPAGYIEHDDTGRRCRWTVQGNDLATWCVLDEDVAA